MVHRPRKPRRKKRTRIDSHRIVCPFRRFAHLSKSIPPNVQVLFRLNFLTVMLCIVMNRPYQFYYFVPLCTFWYLVLYLAMAMWPRAYIVATANTSKAGWTIHGIFLCRALSVRLDLWFSTWGRDPPRGVVDDFWKGRDPRRIREPFVEGSRVDSLCAQLYCICFIRVLYVGGRRVTVGFYDESRYTKG